MSDDKQELCKVSPKKKPNKSSLSECFPKKSLVHIGIPILNKDTSNADTYDADRLLDFKVQKEATSSHRIKNSNNMAFTKFSSPKKPFRKENKLFTSSCKTFSTKLLEKKNEKNEKIEKLREELIQKELQECTFHPKISSEKKMRSHEEYYRDQQKFEEKKMEKLKEKQKELSQSVLTEISRFSHVPSIEEKSVMLASKHVYDESTYERLHKGIKPKVFNELCEKTDSDEKKISKEKSEESQFTFTPTLNMRSKNLLRIAQVDDILYEDAKRRQKLKNEPKIIQSFESSVNPLSEKMLIEKFYKEFMEICDWDPLTYSDFSIVLHSMFFVLGLEKHKSKEQELISRLWNKLSSDNESTPNERVLMNLMAIMKYQTSMFINSEEAISPEETETIHLQFYLFFENRASITHKSNVNRSMKNEPEFNFVPEICENSRRIAESSNFEEIQKKKHKKKMEAIKEVEEKTFEECTFQPMISPIFLQIDSEQIKDPLFKEYLQTSTDCNHRGEMLFNFSQAAREKKENIWNVEREKIKEKELENCTFVPNVDKKLNDKKIVTTEDLKKTFERLSKSKNHTEIPKKKVEKSNRCSFAKIDSEYEIEKKFQEWEEKKMKELKQKKIEEEIKLKSQKELEIQKKKKIEDEKRVKFERVKRVAEERKAKELEQKKRDAKIKNVSFLAEPDEI